MTQQLKNYKELSQFVIQKSTYWISLYYILAIISSYFTAVSPTGTDFDAYIDAAKKLELGYDIYNQYQPYYSMQYYYSVFFAWIIKFFIKWDLILQIAWNMISYALMHRIYLYLCKLLEIDQIKIPRQVLFHLIFLTLTITIVAHNVSRNQVTVFILWTIIESYRLLSKKENLKAAFLLGLGINIKLLPLGVVPYFIVKKKWTFIAYTIVIVLFLFLIPAVGIGWDRNMDLLKSWWNTINPYNTEHLVEYKLSRGIISLSALVASYFYSNEEFKGIFSEYVSLHSDQVKFVVHILRILVILPFFRILKFNRHDYTPLFYLCTIIPLVFPHQQKYALLFVFPMIMYLTKLFLCMPQPLYGKQKLALCLFIISLISFSPLNGSDIIGRYYFDLFQDYKTLSISTIFITISFLVAKSKEKGNQVS